MLNPTKTQANRAPWNNRRRIGPKPPLKLREIWAIRIRLQLAKRTRDLALFNLAIDTIDDGHFPTTSGQSSGRGQHPICGCSLQRGSLKLERQLGKL